MVGFHAYKQTEAFPPSKFRRWLPSKEGLEQWGLNFLVTFVLKNIMLLYNKRFIHYLDFFFFLRFEGWVGERIGYGIFSDNKTRETTCI